MAATTETYATNDPRRKLAYALATAGMDTSPVQAWTQGAARILQGALGGWQLRKLDEQDKAADAKLLELPGLGGPAASAQPEVGGGDVLERIKKFEGFTPQAKWDYKQNSNGYGTRATAPGEVVDQATAEARLRDEVGKASGIVDRFKPDLPSGARDALTSLTYNAGDKWTRSGLGQAIQSGDMNAAKERFLQYNQAGGQVLPGLVNRRQQEAQWFDRPAQTAALGGMPTPDGQPMPPQSAQQPNVQMAQASLGQPQRSSVSIPPDVAMSIRSMIANPRTRQYGMALYSQFAKPTDQYVPVSDARGNVVGQRSQLTGEIKTVPQDPEPLRVVQEMYARPQAYGFTGPNDPALQEAARHKLSGQSTSVAVSTVANPVLEGVGKQIVASRQSAQAAAQLIPQIHDARRVLDEGMTTGAFADPRVFAQKVGSLFGMDAKDAANAETFRAIIGNQVLSHIKALGANPSNTDRDYIEKVMGGTVALEPSSLRRIMDINEKYARQAIRQFNGDSKKLLEADPNAYRGIAPLMQIDEPGNYTGGSLKQKYGLE